MKRFPAKDWLGILALTFTMIGVVTALRSLDKNGDGLVGNIRGQLYVGVRGLYARELNEAGGRLNSIYATIDPKGLGTQDYARARLRLLAPQETDALMAKAATAPALYQALFGAEIYQTRAFPLTGEFLELRRTQLHVEEYFYHMAAVNDYRREGILKEGEWRTWRAWFGRIGPHPFLLIALHDALASGYIGQGYALEVRDALCGNDPEVKRIVREYLGPKYGPAFVDGALDFLPKY